MWVGRDSVTLIMSTACVCLALCHACGRCPSHEHPRYADELAMSVYVCRDGVI